MKGVLYGEKYQAEWHMGK